MSSAQRTASLRLTLNGAGFASGYAKLRAVIQGENKKMAAGWSVVGSAAEASMKRAKRSFEDIAKLGSSASGPFGGILAGLKQVENRSEAIARRVSGGFRSAFKGIFGAGVRGKTMDKESFFAQQEGGGRGVLPKGMGAFAGGLVTGVASKVVDLAGQAVGKVVDLTAGAGKVEDMARQLSVSARQSGGQYIDPKVLSAEFFATAKTVKGTTGEEAADAAQKFYALTGDIDTVRGSLVTFAHIARATGGTMGEVAESAASISQQFKITNPEELKDVFATLSYQGKAGAIELKDLAGGLQRLAAAGAGFGLTGSKGVKQLGGFVQLARRGTGSADQAFTAVEDFFAQLMEKGKVLKKEGVNVYEGKGASKKTRDVMDIVVESISKIGKGDIAKRNEKLQSIYGMQGFRAIKPLMAIYDTAYRGASGTGGKDATKEERTAAGIAALRKEIDGAVNVTGTWKDVLSDSAKMQETSGAKMTAMWETLKQKAGTELLPKLALFVDSLTKSPEILDAFMQSIVLLGKGLQQVLEMLGIRSEADQAQRDTEGKYGHEAVAAQKIKDAEQAAAAKEVDSAGNQERVKKLFEKKSAVESFEETRTALGPGSETPMGPLAKKRAAERAAGPPAAALPAGAPPASPMPAMRDFKLNLPAVISVALVEDRTGSGGKSPPPPGWVSRGR